MLPDCTDGSCLLARYAKTDVQPRLRGKHPTFCPVYVLQNRLQNRRAYPKWDPRAYLGINLGQSPRHAQNINLILNLDA
eukprot:14941089-Ditylum_brightwellii.AAC.1